MRHLTVGLVTVMTLVAQYAFAATERPIPQFWLKASSSSICTFRVDTPNASLEKYLRFAGESYARTEQWSGDFGIAGVDYVRFRKFYLFTLKVGCSDVAGARKFIKAYFPAATVMADEDGKQYLGRLSDWDAGPINLFRRYKPNTSLQSCMISFQTRSGVDPMKFYEGFSGLVAKYRFPIMHVHFANERFDLPFSDYCDQREPLLRGLLTAADRDHLPLRDQMAGVSFVAGEKEYRTHFPNQ